MIEVEQFEPFYDLPNLDFVGGEEVVFESQDILILHKKVGCYAVYRVEYIILPHDHPDKFTFHVFDIDQLEKQHKKSLRCTTPGWKKLPLDKVLTILALIFRLAEFIVIVILGGGITKINHYESPHHRFTR